MKVKKFKGYMFKYDTPFLWQNINIDEANNSFGVDALKTDEEYQTIFKRKDEILNIKKELEITAPIVKVEIIIKQKGKL